MPREYVLHSFRSDLPLQIDYPKELNEQQLAAVTATPGPALVIAGAGSGKTRTLIYRVAFLLEQGIPPERIILLTFTNKAAREMMRRVADLLGAELSSLWGGTFHSVANRVLRRHADLLGFTRDFSILDREDATDLLKTCLETVPSLDEKAIFPKADVLAEIFSLAANTLTSVRELLEKQYDYFLEFSDAIAAVQQEYQRRKKAANSMDFDDLLVFWLQLFKEQADLCETYQRRFQFVLVDEYQDTNKLQAELIDLLAARHHNLMVVGDDAQSIYSWRGANFQNILEFPQRYPNAAVYKIETNYRSTPEILAVANAAIAPNQHQYAKQLQPHRKAGAKPVLVPCGNAHDQAAFVAQRALELREEGQTLNEMAVLYRSHFHALELQLELTRRNIPFVITSGIRFFEQAHLKDVAAFLKFVCNPHDELSFKRIIRLLRGIGGKIAEKLWADFQSAAAAAPPAPADPGAAPAAVPRLAALLQKLSPKIPKKTAVAWAQLSATIAQLETPPVRQSAARMISVTLEAIYEEHLQEAYANYRARKEDLDQLAAFAVSFPTVEEFLAQMALLTNIEADDQQAAPPDQERLRLSTIHQAKGLEFSTVFLIMLCDGLFPSARSLNLPVMEEEERRLFYVAITRAKLELYLSHPFIRPSAGGADVMLKPSRFLKDIPVDLLEVWNLTGFERFT